MDFKMPKSQEQSEQLQNKELESIAGGGTWRSSKKPLVAR